MWHSKTLEELDYFRILKEISSFCASCEAAAEIEKSFPLTDGTEIEELKSLGREWTRALSEDSSTAVKNWNQIQQYFKVMKIEGASLEQHEIFDIYIFSESAQTAADAINRLSKKIPLKNLSALAEKLPRNEINSAQSEIAKVLDKNGVLKDLPVLREIKAKIASIRSDIEHALKKYTADSSLSNVLASNVPAFRADRQVLAVRANMRTRISGIVHEVSASGATMFIEPDEVVRKNNELIQEEFHLQAETRKIFTALTEKIAPFAPALEFSLEIMKKLDKTCAAAKWGIENGCAFAIPCKDEKTQTELPPRLLRARHPVLGERAIPIDMVFRAEKRILIITGPNTGGKTVSLKTFALLSMLNQSGFPIPAGEGTRLPVFDSLFADIGDEQSIDQSLSTFSAHMKNIAAAARHAGAKSLVLLDELGSGTDPQEGGAVAMAVLDTLIEKGAFVLVTTHHGILKNYGYTNIFCENASVEFDSQTLSPTYRLLTGIPGESHALDIAKKSGLPRSVVEKAKSYINSEQADVSSLIKGLTQKHAEAAELEKECRSRTLLLEEKELKFQQKLIRLREREIALQEREKSENSDFLRETRKKLENLVRTLREGEITREKTLGVKKFIADLTDQIEDQESGFEAEKAKLEEEKKALDEKIKTQAVRAENGMLISKDNSKHSSSKKTKKRLSNREALLKSKNSYTDEEAELLAAKLSNGFVTKSAAEAGTQKIFEPGAEVTHNQTKMNGTLLEKEKEGVWAVQFGSIRMNVREKDMTLTFSKPAPSVTVELVKSAGSGDKPVFELRLLGMRQEEAIKALERQLDLCQIHNFKAFSIIHGKGNGILQQAVHDYLSQYTAVKSFRFANAEDGGFGKTYVELS